MKPNWEESPSWANWWAIDEGDDDGFAEWMWLEEEPELNHEYQFWVPSTKRLVKGSFDYTTTYAGGPAYKEKRPEEYR